MIVSVQIWYRHDAPTLFRNMIHQELEEGSGGINHGGGKSVQRDSGLIVGQICNVKDMWPSLSFTNISIVDSNPDDASAHNNNVFKSYLEVQMNMERYMCTDFNSDLFFNSF